jgi:dipeptidyl aminopeptidase/acylaminoacyl peptidase
MQDDLIDGVNWAIKHRIADPKRIAIFGYSYGGYTTLMGLASSPDVFCCGVDICGPANLITYIKTLPPYLKPIEPLVFDRVGHPERDADFLKSRSPLFMADRITKPLLIAQGANDPHVQKSESLRMVEALRKAGKVVEYVEYPDEGHGFARPENRLDFYAKAEKFLARHLGGRYEE